VPHARRWANHVNQKPKCAQVAASCAPQQPEPCTDAAVHCAAATRPAQPHQTGTSAARRRGASHSTTSEKPSTAAARHTVLPKPAAAKCTLWSPARQNLHIAAQCLTPTQALRYAEPRSLRPGRPARAAGACASAQTSLPTASLRRCATGLASPPPRRARPRRPRDRPRGSGALGALVEEQRGLQALLAHVRAHLAPAAHQPHLRARRASVHASLPYTL